MTQADYLQLKECRELANKQNCFIVMKPDKIVLYRISPPKNQMVECASTVTLMLKHLNKGTEKK